MARPPVSLASLLDRSENSFNLVRLAAAAAVLVSHSFALLQGGNAAQPLAWGPFNLGANAVNVFFILSGLMLSRSFDHRPDWRLFTAARLLRILPALLVAGVATAWAIGPVFSDRPLIEYFSELHALLYPVLSLFGGHAHVHFTGSPFPDDINTSLWTIKYELLAYLVFGTTAALGLLRSRFIAVCTMIVLGFGLLLVAQSEILNDTIVDNFVRFGFCFALGVVLYRFRDMVQIRPLPSLALLGQQHWTNPPERW